MFQLDRRRRLDCYLSYTCNMKQWLMPRNVLAALLLSALIPLVVSAQEPLITYKSLNSELALTSPGPR